MSTPAWNAKCRLREEVRSGTLRLAEFAADLNAVRTGEAPTVYREANAFFSRTYPTYNLKRLVRDCLLRLGGQGGVPVIRFDVSYGGGKTHTLITLLHLAERGLDLQDHPTVKEFVQFAGIEKAPKARVALLPFDKFDVHEGLLVYGPDGGTRRVKTPWGALAYQLAGDAGFARVKAHEEGYDPPADPVIVDLLREPEKQGLGTLILLDEAVWYYRAAVNHDARRLGTLKDFFHSLIQAVVKVNRCSLVATLIASAVESRDATGALVLQALEDEFRRYEENFEPVAKEDLAEILRRRLFETVPPEDDRRSVIDAVMAKMQQLPLREAQKNQQAYERLLRAYPFHPDLLNVLYEKWKQFEGFQNARGMLRVLALATRVAESSDTSPLIGPAALLGKETELTDAMVELIDKCKSEADWAKILVGELDKAREIQAEFPSLKNREVEQAVVATFLHSQPRGQKAEPSDLHVLLAHAKLDVASLTEGLAKWRERSWFLSEEPGVWRLGTQPNLTHMHVRAIEKIASKPTQVDDELRSRIRAARLAEVEPGVTPHNLPDSPRDVGDTPELHFVVLAPSCAADPGKPVPPNVEAYFNTTSGPGNPRTYRNAVIAVAPDRARLAGLRQRVLHWMAWKEVESGDDAKMISDLQRKELARRRKEAEDGLPDAVRATYSVLLAVDEQGSIESKFLAPGSGSLFERAKQALIDDERLLATSLDPELFLPGSYLELWSEGEKAKRAKDFVAAFAQFPRLPRLLGPGVLQASLARGVREGKIVLQIPRGDGSIRTLWRVEPSPDDLSRPETEVVPVAHGALHEVQPELLLPERCEGLWLADSAPLKLDRLLGFFDGTHAPRVASPEVLDKAVRACVQRGMLMARSDGNVFLRQTLPEGPLSRDLELLVPPPPVHGSDLGPKEIPEAWSEQSTSLSHLAKAISTRRGHAVPWVLLRDAVSEALAARLFEVVEEGAWPCGPEDMSRVHFRIVDIVELNPAELVSSATKDVWAGPAPTVGKLKTSLEAAKGRRLPDDVFRTAIEGALSRGLFALADPTKPLPTGKGLAAVRVRMPKASLFAEAQLSAQQIQDFAAIVPDLKRAAAELDFSFRVTITAEGEKPSDELVEELNKLLGGVSETWRLE